MSIPKVFDDVVVYFSGAIGRIFGLDDDAYPNTGIQPFTGEVYNKKNDLGR